MIGQIGKETIETQHQQRIKHAQANLQDTTLEQEDRHQRHDRDARCRVLQSGQRDFLADPLRRLLLFSARVAAARRFYARKKDKAMNRVPALSLAYDV